MALLMKTDFDIITKELIRIAKYAGKEIMKIYNSKSINYTLKSDNSPLTDADIASHAVITNGLTGIDSNIPILSEESENITWRERKAWSRYWLVDPLDGTKEFINKNGEFTVNIALIDKHTPMIGVVYAPASDQLWIGNKYQSLAMKIINNKSEIIRARSCSQGEKLKIVVSRSHVNNRLNEYLRNFDDYEIISVGSSIKLCLVAEGSAHIYPRLGLTYEWDTAAAHAIVEAAGGNVLNINNGRTLEYNRKCDLLNPNFVVKKHSMQSFN